MGGYDWIPLALEKSKKCAREDEGRGGPASTSARGFALRRSVAENTLPPLVIPAPQNAPAARRLRAPPSHEGLSPKKLRAQRDRTRACARPAQGPAPAEPPRIKNRNEHQNGPGQFCSPCVPRPPRAPTTAPQPRRLPRGVARPASSSTCASDAGLASDPRMDAVEARRKKSVRQMTTVELMTNPRGPVLDYSFLEIADVSELRSIAPRSGYREKPPDKIETKDRYGRATVVDNPLCKEWTPPPAGPGGQKLVTEGIKLSNNQLSMLPGATHIILREILERSWLLRWVDLSFNQLEHIPDILASYGRLNTLYLHCNRIHSAAQTKSLARLENLHALTLHGNPCEDSKHYKNVVLSYCPALRKLDFSTVIGQDREAAQVFLHRVSAASKVKDCSPHDEAEVIPPRTHHVGGMHSGTDYAMAVATAQGLERERAHGAPIGP
jgi:hypothetical protein